MAITQLDRRTYRVAPNNGCNKTTEDRNDAVTPECKKVGPFAFGSKTT
jgi:hypothetical protein